ncbi:hypothetical protein ACFFS2_26750 [Streptomyces aurantiacus]|uniref:Uncharacterized protein n=1 Tax=Streptomyces aurantiacus TaxID=47760 RepID=A0A7G1P7F2_9ACTN|nr:hypothetical protein [Streptomyces aurantiacus]BCL29737.1 hypothetical protein GCM10017557_45960 [Streptomyces aurantiacus]
MSITDTNCTASEHIPPSPLPVNGTVKGSARSEQAEADAARIILQLEQNHAGSNAAGLGSPELDEFQNLIVSLVAEADDPKAVIARLAELLSEHAENKACLPKLIQECERLGLALQLTDDPVEELPEIRIIDGVRTVVARSDEVGMAYDDVHAIGRCLTCSGELDDTALLYFPADAVLSPDLLRQYPGHDRRGRQGLPHMRRGIRSPAHRRPARR